MAPKQSFCPFSPQRKVKRMTATVARVAYHSTVREMPSDERPRERLEHYGAASLQTAELLAIILRVGTAQENVIELSSRLLRLYGGLGGLLAVDFAKLCREHGLGQAKAAQLKAALEIGRRLSVLAPAERPQITQPADIANLVRFNMGDALPYAIWSASSTQPQAAPSSIWHYGLGCALRRGTLCFRPPGRRQSYQTDGPRARPSRLAHQCALAGVRARSSALSAAVIPGVAAH